MKKRYYNDIKSPPGKLGSDYTNHPYTWAGETLADVRAWLKSSRAGATASFLLTRQEFSRLTKQELYDNQVAYQADVYGKNVIRLTLTDTSALNTSDDVINWLTKRRDKTRLHANYFIIPHRELDQLPLGFFAENDIWVKTMGYPLGLERRYTWLRITDCATYHPIEDRLKELRQKLKKEAKKPATAPTAPLL